MPRVSRSPLVSFSLRECKLWHNDRQVETDPSESSLKCNSSLPGKIISKRCSKHWNRSCWRWESPLYMVREEVWMIQGWRESGKAIQAVLEENQRDYGSHPPASSFSLFTLTHEVTCFRRPRLESFKSTDLCPCFDPGKLSVVIRVYRDAFSIFPPFSYPQLTHNARYTQESKSDPPLPHMRKQRGGSCNNCWSRLEQQQWVEYLYYRERRKTQCARGYGW